VKKAGPAGTRFLDRPAIRNFVGRYILGGYVHLAMGTSRVDYHPPDYRQRCLALHPAIYVIWHANMVAIGHVAPDHANTRVLVSPHPDGRMGAAAIATWGGKVIYGTGASFKQREGTRAVAGSLEVLRALDSGLSMLMTADVPPIRGRKVSRGVIRLARLSGRPIIPVAVGSSRRTIFARIWDETQINHPFSRVAVVGGEPIHVAEGIDDETARATLKATLDDCYARALSLTAPLDRVQPAR
jgi:lysophospholipid acyltransferase (LPLAT)-like uncharacterized protein